jgi:hypothetical protein
LRSLTLAILALGIVIAVVVDSASLANDVNDGVSG